MEEGLEGVVFVQRVILFGEKTSWVDTFIKLVVSDFTMLETEEFPAGRADLDTCLTDMN